MGLDKRLQFCEAHTEEQKKTCGGRGTKWMASNLRGVNESLEEEKPMIITIHNVIRIKDCKECKL